MIVIAPVHMALASLGISNETEEKDTLYLFTFQIMLLSTTFSCIVFYIPSRSQTLNRVKLLIAEGVKEIRRQK